MGLVVASGEYSSGEYSSRWLVYISRLHQPPPAPLRPAIPLRSTTPLRSASLLTHSPASL